MSDPSIHSRLGRIEGSLGLLIDMQREHNAQTNELTRRVGSLERTRAYFIGVCAAVSAIFAGAMSYVVSRINGN